MTKLIPQDVLEIIMKHHYNFKYTKLMNKCMDEFKHGLIKSQDVFLFQNNVTQFQALFCHDCGGYINCQKQPALKTLCLCKINSMYHQIILSHTN